MAHAWTRHTFPYPHNSLQPPQAPGSLQRGCIAMCPISSALDPGQHRVFCTQHSPNYSRLITAPLCRSVGQREPNHGLPNWERHGARGSLKGGALTSQESH